MTVYLFSSAGRLKTLTGVHLIAWKQNPKHIISCFIIFLIWYGITWAVWTPLSQFGENLSLRMENSALLCVNNTQHTGHDNDFLFMLTFPLWFQSGGSSCPWGSRPVSRQVRNWRRWPPLGKCRGGLWMPSWLTKTTVPPLFTGEMTSDYNKGEKSPTLGA